MLTRIGTVLLILNFIVLRPINSEHALRCISGLTAWYKSRALDGDRLVSKEGWREPEVITRPG